MLLKSLGPSVCFKTELPHIKVLKFKFTQEMVELYFFPVMQLN